MPRAVLASAAFITVLLTGGIPAVAQEAGAPAAVPPAAAENPYQTPQAEPKPTYSRPRLDVERAPNRPQRTLDLERPPSYKKTLADPDEKPHHSDARWIIIGVGGSIAVADIAAGAALLAGGPTQSVRTAGVGTLVGGITGLLFSVIVGALIQ